MNLDHIDQHTNTSTRKLGKLINDVFCIKIVFPPVWHNGLSPIECERDHLKCTVACINCKFQLSATAEENKDPTVEITATIFKRSIRHNISSRNRRTKEARQIQRKSRLLFLIRRSRARWSFDDKEIFACFATYFSIGARDIELVFLSIPIF